MSKIATIISVVIALSLIDFGNTINHVPAQEWSDYKLEFNKDYTNSATTEAYAQYYYAYNKVLINNHNTLYERGQRTFKLKVNQFTDMRLIQFNALFPVAPPMKTSIAVAGPAVNPAPISYDPIRDFGFSTTVQNQGTICNSGWAYAAAKSIEILLAQQTGTMTPAALSAQNLIDCAGRSNGCKSQVPQAAFDYMAQYGMDLYLESEYKNNNTLSEPGMCIPNGVVATNLGKYSKIDDGDDESIKSYVAAGFPVVVEFNPTSFEFMHYSEGVFQQPATQTGSHFMVVIGYDTNATTGIDYWILQNSFDKSWGEMGLMRIVRSATTKLAKNAVFPSELA